MIGEAKQIRWLTKRHFRHYWFWLVTLILFNLLDTMRRKGKRPRKQNVCTKVAKIRKLKVGFVYKLFRKADFTYCCILFQCHARISLTYPEAKTNTNTHKENSSTNFQLPKTMNQHKSITHTNTSIICIYSLTKNMFLTPRQTTVLFPKKQNIYLYQKNGFK